MSPSVIKLGTGVASHASPSQAHSAGSYVYGSRKPAPSVNRVAPPDA